MSKYRRGIFVVPDWVEKSLARQGKQLSELLSPQGLNQFLSYEDLAVTLYLNREAPRLLGARIDDLLILDQLWSTANDPVGQYRYHVLPMLHDPKIHQSLTDRLFDEELGKPDTAFHVQDVQGSEWAVVIHAGGFSPAHREEASKSLKENLCRMIHEHSSMQELASTNLFVQVVAEGHLF